jgi:hypothetical protein
MVVITRPSMGVWERCNLALQRLTNSFLQEGLYMHDSMPLVQLNAIICLLCFVTLDVEQGLIQEENFPCEREYYLALGTINSWSCMGQIFPSFSKLCCSISKKERLPL